MPSPIVHYVDASKMRSLFSDGDFVVRVRNGELSELVLESNHPSPPRASEPRCTRSQIVAYLDWSGQTVAIVHQYRRRDGTLGASGQPDPKQLWHDGFLYVLEA